MNGFIHRAVAFLMRLGTAVASLCGTGVQLAVRPVIGLVLRAVRKGNRAAARLVHCVRRFVYIAGRYGYKRAVRLTGYRLEQIAAGYLPQMKRGFVRLVPMALAAVVLVISLHCWTAFTMAYEVNYDGNNVGYVANESVVEDACQLISDRIVEEAFDAKEVTYTLKVVSAAAVNDAAEICENIIQVSDELEMAVGLYVDDQLVTVCRSGAAIERAMNQVASAYIDHNGGETVTFANTIEYISGLYAADTVTDSVSSEELSQVLTVMMTVTETYTQSIDYGTTQVEDSSRYVGYRTVTKKGIKGEKEITAEVSYINGEVVETTVLAERVIKEPKNQIVTVGTKQYSKASDTDTGTSLFWPVEGTDVYNISSYFGDGRNHKGTDILAPKGTPIYAAEDGKVTYVGWESGYGYYCVVDHGDGISTLYAHCSSIAAVEGQRVSRGDYIAAVGITGRASAYHLHFEVRINGTAVDARPYLGID